MYIHFNQSVTCRSFGRNSIIKIFSLVIVFATSLLFVDEASAAKYVGKCSSLTNITSGQLSCGVPLLSASVSTPASSILFAPSIIKIEHSIADSVQKPFTPSISIDNPTDSNILINVHVPNKPNWIKEPVVIKNIGISKGKPLFLQLVIDPKGLKVGTYKTEVVITAPSVGYRQTLPVVLEVGKTPVAASGSYIKITNPGVDFVWNVGDKEKFKWTAKNVPRQQKGGIFLIGASGLTSHIADVKNTGSYAWKVGTVLNGYALTPGEYTAKIQFGNTSKSIGPLTIDYKKTVPIKIDASLEYNKEAYITDNAWTPYVISFSGGKSKNPVSRWAVEFVCPDNVVETSTKGSGEMCGGTNLWESVASKNGNISVTFAARFSNQKKSNLGVRVQAIGADGVVMGFKDFQFPIQQKSI